ncbi:MAG: 4Fe-4S binding protein [Caldisericaceae bacterium]
MRYLLLLVSLGVLGFYFGGCPCPMGFVEKIWLTPFGSTLSISILVMLGIITVVTLFKGRIFCGWVCPHGALQEFLFQKNVAIKINPKLDKRLKYVKYFVLIFVIAFALVTGTSILCKIEPFKGIYNLTATGIGLGLIIITLVASVFIYRPWCRYICPFGAYLGVVSWIGGKLHLNRTKITNKCLLCKNCVKACPANSIIDEGNSFEIDYKECFTCGECMDNCPQNRKKS